MSHPSTTYLSLLFNEGIYIIKEDKRHSTNETIVSEPVESFKYIGENKKQILIITHHKSTNLTNSEKDFLLKILLALKLSINDVAIINSDHLDYDKLKMLFKPRFVLAFVGDKNIEFLNEGMYLFSEHEDAFLLRADELSIIETDKTKKTVLWNSLKEVLKEI